MKTPEEIKYGLASHGYEICDKRCAYHDWRGTGHDCSSMLCQDAHTYIEKLESQIPRWIPVEEQLPPDGIADYLVTIKQKYPHETEWEYYTDKATYGGSYIDGLWDTEYDWIEGQETHITHWMSMPKPLIEKKGE